MELYLLPALFALFVWWFSTGAIIYLDGLPQATFRWTLLGATLLMLVSVWGVTEYRDDLSVGGAYATFTYTMLIWAWLETTFYLGFITGIRQVNCLPGCSGWKHFVHAVQANLHHELLSIGVGLGLLALTWGHANQLALWTFVVMWLMTLSAKVNVFFGVRNLNEEFLPEHLQFLKCFFRKKPMNLFFPFSVTFSTAVWVAMLQQASDQLSPAATIVGLTLLATMMGVAILEHWLLVLPLPANLWGWSLQSHKQHTSQASDVTDVRA
jgi:putative photosynthetic complex assembly protein 2